MSKNYILTKTTPNDILFNLHPVSNMALTRRIYLTNLKPKIALPEDWALGVFQDEGVYEMYRKGFFTFDDNESIVKAAFEAGVYFGDSLDFEPSTEDKVKNIVAVLKEGNRSKILEAIKQYDAATVQDVAIANLGELSQAVVKMLENILKVQLVVDGE